VKALAELPSLFSPESRRALVVPSDLGFGMARVFEQRSGERRRDIRVFREIDEARRWLAGRED